MERYDAMCLECGKKFGKGDTVAIDQHGNEGCNVCSKKTKNGSVFVMLVPIAKG